MPERTEEDKILKSPVMVILGGKEYEIKPLVIRESREWRNKLSKLLGNLPAVSKTNTEDAEAVTAAITTLMASAPDEIIDLFFAYAKDLNREEIENTATEVELSKAMEVVIGMAFPLVSGVGKAMEKLSQ